MGSMMLPDMVVIGGGLYAGIMTVALVMVIGTLKSDRLLWTMFKAIRGEGKMGVVHYPSGNCDFEIPKLEPVFGKSSPVWNICGKRFKDRTGLKWERWGNLNVIHYTAKHPTPLGTDQAIAIDQLNQLLNDKGLFTRGMVKEIFFMLTESAKGPRAEIAAWRKLGITDEATRKQIRDVLDYVRDNPDIRHQMFEEGMFTYQTAVSFLDQVSADTISETSDLISHTEDRMRRKLTDDTGQLMRYAMIIIPVMLVAAIAGVIFLTGTGIIKV